MIVDCNVYVSRWPFRRLAGDETPELAARLRKHGITQALAGSFDGILHKDIAGVNARLAAECASHGRGFLLPVGSVNPKLPGWRDDVRRCAEEHRMRGIRLHPNYHGYDLRDPDFEELLRRAAERGLFVQLVAAMEDVRTQHPLLRVAPVDLSPLAEVAARLPSLRLMLLNWWPALRSKPLEPLAAAGSVYFDIAMFEGIEGIARLAARLPGGRIVFGSNFPLFPVEAAFLKMQESGLPEPARNQILGGNAGRLLSGGS